MTVKEKFDLLAYEYECTRKELAKRIGVTYASVNDWIRKNKIPLRWQKQIDTLLINV